MRPTYWEYFRCQSIYLSGILIIQSKTFTTKCVTIENSPAQVFGTIFMIYGLSLLWFSCINKVIKIISAMFLGVFLLILFIDSFALVFLYPNIYTFLFVIASVPINSWIIRCGVNKGAQEGDGKGVQDDLVMENKVKTEVEKEKSGNKSRWRRKIERKNRK